MDSVEVTFDNGVGTTPVWSVYLQAFSPEAGGLVGAQEWHGAGIAMTETMWRQIRRAVERAVERMILAEGLVQVVCNEHAVPWCLACGTARWQPGPFD